jgi:hypothetical protein
MYQQLNVDILGIVENMSYFIAPDTGHEYDLFGRGGAKRAAEKLGVPFLGEIPINVNIPKAGDSGRPADVFESDAQGISTAVTSFVETLAGQVSIKAATQSEPLTLNIHQ